MITNQSSLAHAWLNYTIENLKDILKLQGIKENSNGLSGSISGKVNGTGVVESILLKYNFYLRYLDMGVGRGLPIGSRSAKAKVLVRQYSSSKTKGRQKIPVHNKPLTFQVKKLHELLMDHYQIKAIQVMETMKSTSQSIEIKI